MRRYYFSGSTRIYQDSSAGTVDYQTGQFTINAISISSTANTDASIDFTIIPTSFDVVAKRGNLIDISTDTPDISVTGEIDTIASGESGAGVGFNSTSSTSY
jgi:phage baseplate assembly protein gpV